MAIHLCWRDGGLALRVKRRIPPPLHCSLATLIRWYRPKKPLQAESTGTENDLRYFSTTGYCNLPMGLPVQIPRVPSRVRSFTVGSRKQVVQAHCQDNSEHHPIGFFGNTGVRIARDHIHLGFWTSGKPVICITTCLADVHARRQGSCRSRRPAKTRKPRPHPPPSPAASSLTGTPNGSATRGVKRAGPVAEE
jgi:hypothetical protein